MRNIHPVQNLQNPAIAIISSLRSWRIKGEGEGLVKERKMKRSVGGGGLGKKKERLP